MGIKTTIRSETIATPMMINQVTLLFIGMLWQSYLSELSECSLIMYRLYASSPSESQSIECFHSRGQHLSKFIGTKEAFA